MIRRVLIAVAVLSSAETASAQPQIGPAPRPAFSPYLNLARPGSSPALNYYGLVRPEIQARQSIQNLQGAVTANQQAIGDFQAGSNDIPGTGHQTTFLNHGAYFMNGGRAVVGNNAYNPLGSTGRSSNALFGGNIRPPSPGSGGTGGTVGTPPARPR